MAARHQENQRRMETTTLQGDGNIVVTNLPGRPRVFEEGDRRRVTFYVSGRAADKIRRAAAVERMSTSQYLRENLSRMLENGAQEKSD